MTTNIFDNLLSQILSTDHKITRERLLSMIEQKKQESHGLLSDEGAARLVAQQLMIIPVSTIGLKDQRIISLHAGFNDVTITGLILSLSQIRQFERSDGKPGKVLRIRITDGSGEMSCVFWDTMAETVVREALSPGFQIRLLHGYTKHGTAGEVEFHLGTRSAYQILSRGNMAHRSLAEASSQLSKGDRLKLRLLKLQKARSENGPTWALCYGEAGMVIVKFWDEHSDNVMSYRQGSQLYISNPWIEERNGMTYVNVGSKSTVEREGSDSAFQPPVANISSIKPSPVLWTISGKIVEKGETREIETKEGRRTRVSNMNLEDGTGKIRVACWDVHADTTESLRIGDSVRVLGVKVRQDMNGENEASTVFLTSIEKL
ncbi:MAG TPA: OB-fold nucleic acid binding domain-containing protein [Candidatus Bathyarchaeia archaeon]|nr:OB-fold nucleic acid binding domain-containing protein [Candidatus Bathyarchaeia archaeon]